MKDILKIFLISIAIFIIFTAGLVFGIKDIRQGVIRKIKGEKEKPEEQENKEVVLDEKDKMLKMIKEKEEELKKREETIKTQEMRIEELKKEIESLKAEIEKRQQNIEKYVVSIDETKKKNIKKLSKMFSKMKPADAVLILDNLDDKTAVSILVFMKERASARLLGAYSARDEASAKRAARLSEMMKKVVQK